MLGDYGWGLYLNNVMGISNEYSMSRNPVSNVSLETNTWTDIKVANTTEGGEFFINNESAGTFGSDKSQISFGDFGQMIAINPGMIAMNCTLEEWVRDVIVTTLKE